jgi:putative endonuclease
MANGMTDCAKFGTCGEEMATRILDSMGLIILERNFRCKAGEIDIIGKRGDCYHFIEVKTRMGNTFGHPADAVNNRKQLKIIQVAKYYLQQHRISNVRVQFDVVEIEVNLLMNCF